MKYLTREGDVLDAICYKIFGGKYRYTEIVLANNPGLADYGPILPAGITVELPEPPSVDRVKSTIRLWD